MFVRDSLRLKHETQQYETTENKLHLLTTSHWQSAFEMKTPNTVTILFCPQRTTWKSLNQSQALGPSVCRSQQPAVLISTAQKTGTQNRSRCFLDRNIRDIKGGAFTGREAHHHHHHTALTSQSLFRATSPACTFHNLLFCYPTHLECT